MDQEVDSSQLPPMVLLMTKAVSGWSLKQWVLRFAKQQPPSNVDLKSDFDTLPQAKIYTPIYLSLHSPETMKLALSARMVKVGLLKNTIACVTVFIYR